MYFITVKGATVGKVHGSFQSILNPEAEYGTGVCVQHRGNNMTEQLDTVIIHGSLNCYTKTSAELADGLNVAMLFTVGEML